MCAVILEVSFGIVAVLCSVLNYVEQYTKQPKILFYPEEDRIYGIIGFWNFGLWFDSSNEII
jgi:hypothetical protein